MDSNEQMEKLHMELTEKAYTSFSLGMRLLCVVLFAMNLFTYGKKEVAMGLIASVAL